MARPERATGRKLLIGSRVASQIAPPIKEPANEHPYEIVNMAALKRWTSSGSVSSGGNERLKTKTAAVENPSGAAHTTTQTPPMAKLAAAIMAEHPATTIGHRRATTRCGTIAAMTDAGSWLTFRLVSAAAVYCEWCVARR